jgi:putative transposon-encoded protein
MLKKTMKKVMKKTIKPAGKSTKLSIAVPNQLFGHVSLIEVYTLPNFKGFHALIGLRDYPDKTIAVMATQHHLQTLLEAGLVSGNLVAIDVAAAASPNPLGNGWTVDIFKMTGGILYSFK